MPAATPSTLRRQPAFRRLRKLLDQPGSLTLLQRHEVGQEMLQLCPDRRYGERVMPSITQALGRSESYAASLLAMRRFRETYTREQVEKLSRPAPRSGFRLGWSHLLLLLSLDPKERSIFQKRCIRNGWSTRTLHRQIKIHHGRRGGGGRRHQRPEDLQSALRQIVDSSRSWQRSCQVVWADPGELAPSSEPDRERAAQQLKELSAEAIGVLEEMRGAIDAALPALRKIQRKKRERR